MCPFLLSFSLIFFKVNTCIRQKKKKKKIQTIKTNRKRSLFYSCFQPLSTPGVADSHYQILRLLLILCWHEQGCSGPLAPYMQQGVQRAWASIPDSGAHCEACTDSLNCKC